MGDFEADQLCGRDVQSTVDVPVLDPTSKKKLTLVEGLDHLDLFSSIEVCCHHFDT
jgi:hypothetical protein